MLSKVSLRFSPLKGVVAYCRVGQHMVSIHSGTFSPRWTYDHLVNQDSEGPPIHGGRVPRRLYHLRRYVLCAMDDVNSGLPYSTRRRGTVPSVPTNEFVRKSAVHDRVSIKGIYTLISVVLRSMWICHTPFSTWWIVAGRPPGSPDCFARSKSDSIMCPDWCKRMSVTQPSEQRCNQRPHGTALRERCVLSGLRSR